MRLKTAVLTAVLAGSLAGPSVLNASAATRSHSVAAVRSHKAPAIKKSQTKKNSSPADASDPAPDPVGVVESIVTEIEFDLSGSNLSTVLWDLPGFGPY